MRWRGERRVFAIYASPCGAVRTWQKGRKKLIQELFLPLGSYRARFSFKAWFNLSSQRCSWRRRGIRGLKKTQCNFLCVKERISKKIRLIFPRTPILQQSLVLFGMQLDYVPLHKYRVQVRQQNQPTHQVQPPDE